MARVPVGDRVLLLSLLLACAGSSEASCLLRGSVACNDCGPMPDLSGVRLAINCSRSEPPSYTMTNSKGEFTAAIPNPSPPSPRCTARLLGGKTQLCAFEKSMASDIVASPAAESPQSSCALQTPLAFFASSCWKLLGRGNGAAGGEKSSSSSPSQPASSPPPDRFGFPPLPPFMYMFPFLPIIGIP